MHLADRIDAVLPLVSKPSRYLGNEFHVIRKTPDRETIQWCLLMPEVYEIGMSHWGLKILYEILNRRPDTLAERAYAPWFDMEAQMRRHGIPLFSLESKRPLAEFDFVGFSLQYELTYTNLVNCLDLAGIPIRAEDRDDRHPLVIAGGPCVSNPEPLSDFIDLFLIGDAEEAIHTVTDRYKGLRGRPRAEILREMAKVPGVYVPLLYEATYGSDGRLLGTRPRHEDVPARVQRQFVTELEDAPWPERPLVPLQGIVQDRLTVEVLRGCTQGCRFCQAGYLYRPVRERSAGKILEIADKGIRDSGWDEIGLVSLSTADHTQLEPIADVLNARFGRDRVAISLPSLRADSFGVGIADKVRETKKTGFTFAPEAGSERLRLAINKLIRDEEFFTAARIAYERGWRLIKIYFMVGLPTETWEDVENTARFVHRIREIGREHGPSCSVNASVGAFVPKSHTPFQWDAFEAPESLKEKIRYLRREVTTRWSRLKWHEVENSHIEAVFSMGDRRLGRAIEHAWREGARYDGWTEHFDYQRWLRAFESAGVDPAEQTRARGFDEALPWDHIDIGVLKKWLVRERKKTEAQDFRPGKSLVADCRHGDCTACGIPGLPNDTKLAPKLEEEDFRRLIASASAGAPRTADNGITWPIRLLFEKTGLSRFISHLEMGTVFARAFRMARIPLAYSQGHKPHPKLSFGPPLPVGIEGTSELIDVELLEPWSEAMAARLNAVLSEGIRIREGRTLPAVPGVRRQSLAALATRAEYEIDLQGLDPARRREIGERSRSFDQEDACLVERTSWSPAVSREVTDWEAPMEAAAAELSDGGGASASDGAAPRTHETGRSSDGTVRPSVETARAPDDAVRPSNDAAAASGGARPARGGRRGRKGSAREERGIRTVDLKQAVISLAPRGNDDGDTKGLRIALFLQHPGGQVANPRIVLEQLFRLSPEEQARVGVVRASILTADGRPVMPPAANGGDTGIPPTTGATADGGTPSSRSVPAAGDRRTAAIERS